MSRIYNNLTIDAKPEWQTYYDPKLVGQYLIEFDRNNPFDPGVLIEMKPGMMVLPPPQPTLGDFLRWCAIRPTTNQHKEK